MCRSLVSSSIIFICFCTDLLWCWLTFGVHVWWCCMFVYYLFGHEFVWFCHRFWMMFGIIFDVFCWCLFRLRTQPAKPSKTNCVTMSLHVFTHQTTNSDDFHNFFIYQFGHLFLMSLGIDFGSILALFWYQNQYLLVIVLGWFFDCTFINFNKNDSKK